MDWRFCDILFALVAKREKIAKLHGQPSTSMLESSQNWMEILCDNNSATIQRFSAPTNHHFRNGTQNGVKIAHEPKSFAVRVLRDFAGHYWVRPIVQQSEATNTESPDAQADNSKPQPCFLGFLFGFKQYCCNKLKIFREARIFIKCVILICVKIDSI